METVKIYLSGGMTGLTMEEQNKWRNQIINAIKYNGYDYNKKPVFFNPVDYYNDEEKNYKTEKEVMEFDLYNLRKSDIVIVNFNAPNSLGTAMELMIAKENHIPVIAFGVEGQQVHSWLVECCTRICGSLREAVEYTVEFILQ